MTTKEANAIVKKYESNDKHSMSLKLKYVKAKSFLRNQALKIN